MFSCLVEIPKSVLTCSNVSIAVGLIYILLFDLFFTFAINQLKIEIDNDIEFNIEINSHTNLSNK